MDCFITPTELLYGINQEEVTVFPELKLTLFGSGPTKNGWLSAMDSAYLRITCRNGKLLVVVANRN